MQSDALSMYEQAMGPGYGRLDPVVQRFHRLAGRVQLSGEVQCRAAEHWLGRLLALCLGAPRGDSRGGLRFELHAQPRTERWTRRFPHGAMTSTLSLQQGRIVERLGAATLYFRLEEKGGSLAMHLERMRFFGVPCPRFLLPAIVAREKGEEGRFRFEVEARVAGLGRVVGYSGYLVLPDESVREFVPG